MCHMYNFIKGHKSIKTQRMIIIQARACVVYSLLHYSCQLFLWDLFHRRDLISLLGLTFQTDYYVKWLLLLSRNFFYSVPYFLCITMNDMTCKIMK